MRLPFLKNKAHKRALKFWMRYGYRTRRPWSFGESHFRLEWIERTQRRLNNLAQKRRAFAIYCDCGYDLAGVPFNDGGRSKNCPECHEWTLMPMDEVERNRRLEHA